MAQFRGIVRGGKGMTSRLGHKTTGLRVEANGWHLGIAVEASHDEHGDVFRVYKTGGSGATTQREQIGEYR